MSFNEFSLIFAMSLVNLGTCIFFYCQTDRKIAAIQEEMKNFHGKLCSLSEKYRK